MKKNDEIRTTYSFRASKAELEAIKNIGEGSISKGIRNLIDFHTSNTDSTDLKTMINKAEAFIDELVLSYGDTKSGRKEIKEYETKLEKLKIKYRKKRKNDIDSLFGHIEKNVAL